MMDTKIGWIGLGRMGILMSQRLLKEGYPLTVYNRSRGKEEILVSGGAIIAESPAKVLEQSDIIIIMVSDDAATRELFQGKNGLLNAEGTDRIIINMSTVSAEISREMGKLCRQKNNYYLDAPVSGSVKQAENGELVIMVGGEESVYNKVKPILDKLGKLTIRVGETGKANITKLAVNALLGIITQGLSESIVYAKNNEISIQDLLTVLNNSALGSTYIKTKGDAIINEKFQPTFALKHIVKDLGLAKESGMNSPLIKTAYTTFLDAQSEFGEEDIISIVKEIKEKNYSD